MTEQEIALRYVRRHLESNRNMRTAIANRLLDEYKKDIDVEYLMGLLRSLWGTLSDTEQFNLAQTVAGARHYNAFLQAMKSE
jgi:hypothetical protein